MSDSAGVWNEYSLGLTAVLTIAVQLSCFVIAYTCSFDKITDLAGSSNFVLNAILTLSTAGFFHTRQVVVTSLVSVWGLRLGSFLLIRVLARGKDERFDQMRERFWAFLGFWIFQIMWVWIVSLPVTILNSSKVDTGFGALDYIGWTLWAIGFVIETIADQSRYNFNSIPDNRGKLLSSGVWSWSRHPNYFGEITLWLGIFLTCASVFQTNTSWAWFSAASPVFTFLILMFLSGVNLAEDRYDERFKGQPTYIEYKRTTSPLIPLPPSVYGRLSTSAKKLFFCEFDRYSRQLRGTEVHAHRSS